jgi:hypothetical protein
VEVVGERGFGFEESLTMSFEAQYFCSVALFAANFIQKINLTLFSSSSSVHQHSSAFHSKI